MAEIRARDLGAQFKKLWESDAPSAEKQALALAEQVVRDLGQVPLCKVRALQDCARA